MRLRQLPNLPAICALVRPIGRHRSRKLLPLCWKRAMLVGRLRIGLQDRRRLFGLRVGDREA